MSQGRMLITDDDPSNRLTLSSLLELEGYTVDTAADLDETGRQLDTSEAYLAIILDLHLGQQNSLEIVPRIRADRPETKILVITGAGYSEEVANLVDGFLEKGQDPDVIIQYLADLLEQN